MSHEEKIVRAWKDPEFRAELSASEKEDVPEHPAGDSDTADDEELDKTSGGQLPTITSGGYVCTLTTECGCPW